MQGSALLALKKPDSSKHVEISTQRGEHRDCQNTSIMALEVMHVCINVSKLLGDCKILYPSQIIQVMGSICAF